MKISNWMVGCVAGVSLITGCVDSGDDKPDVSDVKGGPDGKAEAWGSADNPALFNSSLEYLVDALPRTGEARNIQSQPRPPLISRRRLHFHGTPSSMAH